MNPVRRAVKRPMLLASVQKAIKAGAPINAGDHVLAGVSGGADSVALLAVLCRLGKKHGFQVTAAHLNHGIRGKAAEKDSEFVAELASGLGVRCVIGRSDVPHRARRKAISLEMAAREARYSFFKRTARKIDATVIATAHTADDQAETILLKLMRGAGAEGLAGIAGKTTISGMTVVRPMLDSAREEVVAFLNRQRLEWREDLSNRDVSFLRNRVRHELLPMIEQRFNPSIAEALCRTAGILGAENQWMNLLAAEKLGRYTRPGGALDIAGLHDEHMAARRRILRLWLVAAGVAAEQLTFDMVCRTDKLIGKRCGSGALDFPSGVVVRRQYDRLVLEKSRGEKPAAPFRMRIQVPGETLLAEKGLRIVTTVAPGLSKERRRTPGSLSARASIRMSSIGKSRLYVRNWKAGDRIAPLGMRGTKKVQDIFVDEKLPVRRRNDVAIFECGGEIVWIPGYSVARGWEIIDRSIPALQIRVERA